jgi:hypothetical protein
LDGVEVGTPDTSVSFNFAGADGLTCIGCRANDPLNSLYLFNGTLDEIRIYNRTLSPEQIRALYNSGAPKYNLTVSQETTSGENWSVAVTPNNGTQDGTIVFSNYLVISEQPNLTSVTLNATSNNNLTSNNLTAYPIGASDYTTLIYDWRTENVSTAVLNMLFDTNVSIKQMFQ